MIFALSLNSSQVLGFLLCLQKGEGRKPVILKVGSGGSVPYICGILLQFLSINLQGLEISFAVGQTGFISTVDLVFKELP